MYRWRTKQNLDYTYSMMYARSRGTYYVQVILSVLNVSFNVQCTIFLPFIRTL